jgi:hypothetical protein
MNCQLFFQIFDLLKVTRQGNSDKHYDTHNNQGCLSSALFTLPVQLLNTLFYCAVVCAVQPLAKAINQKQPGKHSGVSKQSVSNDYPVNSRQAGGKETDTDCQRKTAEFSLDVEENGCPSLISLLISPIQAPTLLGYKGTFILLNSF